MNNSEIRIDELKSAIKCLKVNKAVGLDELPAEILKCDKLLNVLLKLFNKCFSSGIIPDIWKQGIINPIPKSSTSYRRDPMNYLGITPTSSVYKLYSNVLNTRLSKWENDNSVLLDNQNGFKKNRSTIDHVISLTSIIETQKLHRKDTFTAFIDFRKAYDSINRNLLFGKLADLGISGLMYKVLTAIYDNVRCSVRINGRFTEWFDVNCGLKQGCSLSSMLFNLYINDLITRINRLNKGIDIDGEKVGILVYPDDVVLLSENEEELQDMLNELNHWCLLNKLEINPDKSKIIHFRSASKPCTSTEFRCGNKVLEILKQYTYLGLLLTEHLDYTIMAKQVANAASRALGLLIAKFKAAGGLPFSTFTKLYNNTVLSRISYGAAVWGCRNFSSIPAVQNRTLRFFLGVGRYTPNAAVNGDTGWDSVYQRQWSNILNHWCRLRLMDQSRLNSRIYQWSVSHGNYRHKNWAHRIKLMLHDANVGELFAAESSNINKRDIKAKVNECLETRIIDKWNNEITRVDARRGNGRNKLRTYRLLKNRYAEETYVRIILPRHHRSAYSKFRMGVAPLRIQTGRYEQIEENRRVCFNCKDTIESEEHVLMACPLYSDERETLFVKLAQYIPDFYSKTNQDKFICILSCDIIPVIRICAKICNDILTVRRNILYR